MELDKEKIYFSCELRFDHQRALCAPEQKCLKTIRCASVGWHLKYMIAYFQGQILSQCSSVYNRT